VIENPQATATLQTLRDLDGILGSFLVADSGTVVAQDLPAYFGTAAADIGPRAQRLQEALSLSQGEVNQCVLRYGPHKISLRPVNGGLLTIVASSDINLPALRMAANLVAKKLPPLASLEGSSHEEPSPSPSAPLEELAATVRESQPALDLSEPASTASSRRPLHSSSAPEAPDGGPSKQRAVYFRGKRIR
jgi:predicted regulator of Ras-like GTPase activity (Roadblock/LC7/MglB family)